MTERVLLKGDFMSGKPSADCDSKSVKCLFYNTTSSSGEVYSNCVHCVAGAQRRMSRVSCSFYTPGEVVPNPAAV